MMGRWLDRAKTGSFQKTAPTPCAEIAEIDFCTNCTPYPARYQKKIEDMANYRDSLARTAEVPFDWLMTHYFTEDDLADIERGLYPDPAGFGQFIKTDWRYPFGWPDEAMNISLPIRGKQ